MKTCNECYPCLVRIALDLAKKATDDKEKQHAILTRCLLEASTFDLADSPAFMAKKINAIVEDITRNYDPYRLDKDHFNEVVHNLLPKFIDEIESSDDKFFTTLKMCALVNIIDSGVYSNPEDIDVEGFFEKVKRSNFVGNTTVDKFKEVFKSAKNIMYVVDNCGEIILDLYFINRFCQDKNITLVVRGSAILNDVTRDELKRFELPKNIEVMDTNDFATGIILKNTTPEFMKRYREVDMVILKGQGNYEGIGDPGRDNVFSMLVCKCNVVGSHIGCGAKIGDLILTNPR